MATTTKKMIFGFVLVMTTFTVLFGCSSAIVYDWALTKEFRVGNSLVFEYDRSLKDVTRVSGALEYQFCDSSFPKAVYNTGHDVVTLTEPGYHYFITSNHSQCKSGQRLDVLVVYDLSSPTPSPPPASNNDLPSGKIYKVGDSKEWSLYNSDFYYKWSQEKQFQFGDTLLFEYDNEDNDVREITGDLEFLYCDPTSPVAVHKTGNDLVRLTKPGVHYFISSEPGHCEAGLKLQVVVGPISNAPKLSPLERLTRWLRTFRSHHH